MRDRAAYDDVFNRDIMNLRYFLDVSYETVIALSHVLGAKLFLTIGTAARRRLALTVVTVR